MSLSKNSGRIFVFFCLLSLLLSPDIYSLDFSSLDQDLANLENLIADTIVNTQEQQRLLDELKASLEESGILISNYENIIQEQENLLAILQKQLGEMSETYRMQSALSAKYGQNSRFWRTFTLIAVPITAVISGTVGWALNK